MPLIDWIFKVNTTSFSVHKTYLNVNAIYFSLCSGYGNHYTPNATKLQVCLWIEPGQENSELANRIEWLVPGPTRDWQPVARGFPWRAPNWTPAATPLCAGRSQKWDRYRYIRICRTYISVYICMYVGKVTVTLPSEPATCLASSFHFAQNIEEVGEFLILII